MIISKRQSFAKTFIFLKAFQFNKKVIVLFGPPGAGKGTYGSLLSKDLKYEIFSTGEDLRNIVKNETLNKNVYSSERIQNIRTKINEGKLVEDDFMFEYVKKKLELIDKATNIQGVILDGYPRTIKQAIHLTSLVSANLTLNIFLKDDIIIRKLLGRRFCPSCKENYNICDINKVNIIS